MPLGPVHIQPTEEVNIYWLISMCSIGKRTISLVDFVSLSFVGDVLLNIFELYAQQQQAQLYFTRAPYRRPPVPYHEPESRHDYQPPNENRRSGSTSAMSVNRRIFVQSKCIIVCVENIKKIFCRIRPKRNIIICIKTQFFMYNIFLVCYFFGALKNPVRLGE